jgi:hypothetical protein
MTVRVQFFLAKNPTYHSKTNHIDIQYHFVRDTVEENKLLMMKVDTLKNVEDSLKKYVSTEKFSCCWVESLTSTSRVDLGLDMNKFPSKHYKTISPPGKLESNTTHRVHYAVSPEIVLWVTEMLKCLQSRSEWGYGIVFYLLDAFIMLFIQIFLGFIHLLSHACILMYLS